MVVSLSSADPVDPASGLPSRYAYTVVDGSGSYRDVADHGTARLSFTPLGRGGILPHGRFHPDARLGLTRPEA